MRTLITGGAGFIGSHLAEALLAAGHEVVVLDDLSTGSVDNIAQLVGKPRFDFTVGSATREPLVAKLIDRCDVVFHLAATVGVRLVMEAPVEMIQNNLRATELVLHHAAARHRVVCITSTSEVYGKTAAIPFTEEGDLVLGCTRKHRWAYACGKLMDEFLALSYWKQRGLPVFIVRLFNTVGPRQSGAYGMVVPRFIRQALAGEPMTVFGGGQQTRSFTYVGDVVRGLLGLLAEPRAAGGVFNLGNDQEVTIEALARRVRHLTGSRSELAWVPYEEAYEEGFEDMPRRVPDLTRIGNLIGYRPQVHLDDILRRTIEHHRAADARQRTAGAATLPTGRRWTPAVSGAAV